jgi:hypothetical protein
LEIYRKKCQNGFKKLKNGKMRLNVSNVESLIREYAIVQRLNGKRQ